MPERLWRLRVSGAMMGMFIGEGRQAQFICTILQGGGLDLLDMERTS